MISTESQPTKSYKKFFVSSGTESPLRAEYVWTTDAGSPDASRLEQIQFDTTGAGERVHGIENNAEPPSLNFAIARSILGAINKRPLIGEPTEVDTQLDRVQFLLSRQDVKEARQRIVELQQRWPESPRVQHFVRILAPPNIKVVPGPPKPSRSQEHRWIRDHAREYPGCWLAVRGHELVAADPSFKVVLEAARNTGCPQDVLIHFQAEQSK